MKYIRTKDGIYSYEPTHDVDVDGFIVQHNLTGWNKPLMKEDIIKITDTIEELCDEFVYYNVYQERNIILSDFDEAYIHYGTINETPFYGAIWTDKGLIYVAKMNDKGELELI